MNESNEKGLPLNFMVALLIADEATKRLGVKHEVQSCCEPDYAPTQRAWLKGENIKFCSGISAPFNRGCNWANNSVRIVRKDDGWAEPVTMKGWEWCREAERRAEAGLDTRVRTPFRKTIFNYSRADMPLFRSDCGETWCAHTFCNETGQWRADESHPEAYEDVTEEVLRWYAEQVAEGLK